MIIGGTSLPRVNVYGIVGIIIVTILLSGCITVEDLPVACTNGSASPNETSNQSLNQTRDVSVVELPKPKEVPPGPLEIPIENPSIKEPSLSPSPIQPSPEETKKKEVKKEVDRQPRVQSTPVPRVPPSKTSVYDETLRVFPVKRVREGDLVTFPNLSATDLDGDTLHYTFGEPLDSKGRWLTKKGDAGRYTAEINVSDGKSITSQTVKIIVEPLNRPPTLDLLKAITVNEGQTIAFTPKAVDPDRDPVTMTYTGWKDHFPYKTGFDDQGVHTITITASDGATNTTQELTITVINVNREPTIKPLPDVTVQEGDRVTLKPTAIDPDNDPLTITYSKPFSNEGKWETRKGDAGKHIVVVTASDGNATSSTRFAVTVTKQNLPPILSGIQDITVDEGQTITLNIQATDPENDSVRISYSGYMTSPTKSFGYEDQGTHKVEVTANDGVSTVVESYTVTVRDVNRAPVFNPEAFE